MMIIQPLQQTGPAFRHFEYEVVAAGPAAELFRSPLKPKSGEGAYARPSGGRGERTKASELNEAWA